MLHHIRQQATELAEATLRKFKHWFHRSGGQPYIYFETSAINHLHEILSFEEAEAISKFVTEKGNHYRISSLVFWEILLTADDTKRESLVLFLQHFAPFPPFAAPEELIIDWLKQGCPRVEPRRQIDSKSLIADVWRDICGDKRKTFVLDRKDLAHRLNLMRKLGHSLRRTILFPAQKDDLLGVVLMDIIDPLVANLSFVRSQPQLNDNDRDLYRISIYFVLMILCGELSMETDVISEFWREEGINDRNERLHHFLQKYEIAIQRGPILTMAYMALHQIKRKKSRGLWADCLHAVYITYSDSFISADEHFYSLKNVDPHFDRISNINSFKGLVAE